MFVSGPLFELEAPYGVERSSTRSAYKPKQALRGGIWGLKCKVAAILIADLIFHFGQEVRTHFLPQFYSIHYEKASWTGLSKTDSHDFVRSLHVGCGEASIIATLDGHLSTECLGLSTLHSDQKRPPTGLMVM